MRGERPNLFSSRALTFRLCPVGLCWVTAKVPASSGVVRPTQHPELAFSLQE